MLQGVLFEDGLQTDLALGVLDNVLNLEQKGNSPVEVCDEWEPEP